jgi:hypothetical protein
MKSSTRTAALIRIGEYGEPMPKSFFLMYTNALLTNALLTAAETCAAADCPDDR